MESIVNPGALASCTWNYIRLPPHGAKHVLPEVCAFRPTRALDQRDKIVFPATLGSCWTKRNHSVIGKYYFIYKNIESFLLKSLFLPQDDPECNRLGRQ